MKSIPHREEFDNSPYVKKFVRIAYVAPMIIAFTSIILSLIFSNWSIFSSSGALIILVGIYIAYNDLSGKIYQRASNNSFTMSELFDIGDLGKFSSEELNEFKEKDRDVEKTKESNLRFSNYVDSKFLKIEVALLTTGTLISGYGDLLLNFLIPLNA
ncbi:MAG: hypothetical protein JJV92_01970 [Desulfosarcina sp.]|nr:hypothetical protein [Desulfobacterales bacterium]